MILILSADNVSYVVMYDKRVKGGARGVNRILKNSSSV